MISNWLLSLLNLEPLSWFGLISATLTGFVFGFERQINAKPIGIRTSVLIVTSVYVFMAISLAISKDSLRTIGQIITGVGFLGGGVIISKEGIVQGMTSAATIWMITSIGVMIGLQYYTLGLKITFFGLFIQLIFSKIERKFKSLKKGPHRF